MQHLAPSEQAMIERIDAATMLAQVQSWSAINTGSNNLAGLAVLADALSDTLSALPGTLKTADGAPVRVIDTAGNGQDAAYGQHLVLSVRPEAPRRLLFTGHMDTVFPIDDPFQSLTWLDADRLNGPGVADMKGGIAVMLAAIAAFEASPVAERIGYDVLLNSDEEAGSPSSAPLIATLARGKFAALTYEPAALPDGTLAGERGGSGNYSLTIRGRSAHAGRNPLDGRNAIVAAAQLVLALKALDNDGLRVNPARIDGGSANNVVPDLAILRFNVRPRSPAHADAFAAILPTIIGQVEREHEVRIHYHGGMSRPPKPLDAASQRLFTLVKDCGAALGQKISWIASGGVCDGNNIAACGVPVVDTLGVRGGAIHSPDEYLIVPSLAERAALSALVLHRLATGDAL